ncbi:DUF2809 domain-containing protein [Cryobacterium sp. MLB-32]|uniref:ribosomal maturation YjgA family protein n=1 Tax=Cryobacterium sp. MLB-32 TaxID=1529318 RepID=UPI0018CFA98D|nr:DUF2809 domain-containing protein [Cryobacterium sp. MLB-32]
MERGQADERVMRRRWVLCAAGGLVVATGLGVHFLADGVLAGLVADALYAVLVYLLVAFVVPRASPARIAVTAAALCALIELFQLSGVPSLLAERWAPIALVLGTTFGAWDLVAYAAGAALAGVIDRLGNRWSRT